MTCLPSQTISHKKSFWEAKGRIAILQAVARAKQSKLLCVILVTLSGAIFFIGARSRDIGQWSPPRGRVNPQVVSTLLAASHSSDIAIPRPCTINCSLIIIYDTLVMASDHSICVIKRPAEHLYYRLSRQYDETLGVGARCRQQHNVVDRIYMGLWAASSWLSALHRPHISIYRSSRAEYLVMLSRNSRRS